MTTPPEALSRAVTSPARSIRGRRLLLWMLVVLAAAVIPAVFVPTLMCRAPDPVLPDLGTVPAFSLIDDEGRPFTEDALRGHPTILGFVFTRCDTVCPVISMKMQRIQERTGDHKGAAIKLLSISVDPTYDTPERLAAYAKRFEADPRRWRFLTGPEDKIRALVTGPFMNSMDVTGKQASGAPNIVHSGYLLLVDGDLVIRGVYNSNDPQKLDELVHHARFLARTSAGGSYKFGD